MAVLSGSSDGFDNPDAVSSYDAAALDAGHARRWFVLLVALGLGGGGPGLGGGGRGDPPDRVVFAVGEPQRPVGPGRDPLWCGDAGAVTVGGDHSGGGDPPDRVTVGVGEP